MNRNDKDGVSDTNGPGQPDQPSPKTGCPLASKQKGGAGKALSLTMRRLF